jgi:DNA invertase Pin-like site-specific DNA recombinase
MEKVGYIRVSTKGQNEARQVREFEKLGIEEKNIYLDKESGGSFERTGYLYMKKRLRKGDILYLESIDRLGRNYKEIITEFKEITDNIGTDIIVLDMPLLDTTKHKDLLGNFISDLVLQVLSFVSHKELENIKKRQKQGIEAAKERGVRFGRPSIDYNTNLFNSEIKKWKEGKQTAVVTYQNLGISKSSFYKILKK